MNKYVITFLVLAMLACSVQSKLPTPKTDIKVFSTLTPSPEYAMVCMAGLLNFREAPGTQSRVNKTLPDGTIVEINQNFTTTPDGAEWRETEFGFVNSRYLCVESE